MKSILFIIALFLFSPLAKAESLNYCLMGRYDAAIDKDFRNSFLLAWRMFEDISGRPLVRPTLEYSVDKEKVKIFIYPDIPKDVAAEVDSNPKAGPIMNVYYHSRWAYYSPIRKAEVIAHELCHFYYRLPDEYGTGENSHSTTKYNCVMGNFVIWGWHGRLCSDCRVKVDAYFRKR